MAWQPKPFEQYREGLAARTYTRRAKPVTPPAPSPVFHSLRLGITADGVPVQFPLSLVLRSMLLNGTSGAGKTNALVHLARQLILQGCSVFVLDLHGSHPDSFFSQVMAFAHDIRLADHRPVTIIDLDDDTSVTPWGLTAKSSTRIEPAVIATGMVATLERITGRDLSESPSTRRTLKLLFTAVAELGLPITDIPLLLDPEDRDGVRAYVINRIADEDVHAGLTALDRLAREPRMAREFRIETIGTTNLFDQLIETPNLRRTFGQTVQGFHPGEAMDSGALTLVNLQGGDLADEGTTTTLAAILLQRIYRDAKTRKNTNQPAIVMADESPPYLTPEVAKGLPQTRKFGVGWVLGAQSLAQLELAGADIFNEALDNTATKLVFRQASHQSAERCAVEVVPLDLEEPKTSTSRPTVVGQEVVLLRNEGESEGDTVTNGRARTAAHTYAEGESEGDTIGQFDAQGASIGHNAGQVLTPSVGWFDIPVVLNESSTALQGTNRAHGNNRARTTARNSAEAYTSALTESDAHARTHNRNHGTTEAFKNVYADLPTQLFSKDEQLYRAARVLMGIPIGAAFASFNADGVARASVVRIPRMPEQRYSKEQLAEIRRALQARSPIALTAEEAERRYHEHRADLRRRAQAEQPKARTYEDDAEPFVMPDAAQEKPLGPKLPGRKPKPKPKPKTRPTKSPHLSVVDGDKAEDDGTHEAE